MSDTVFTNASDPSFVAGVDGGGTKSRCVLADMQGNTISKVEGGPCNQLLIGADAAARNVVQLLTACCGNVGCPPAALHAVVLGLAGAGVGPDRDHLLRTLRALLAQSGLTALSISLDTDARIALEGAFEGKSGVVVIAGTGSVVLGKSSSGSLVRIGGWGRILGDEGSGYHVGREALRAVARDLDGMGSSGVLRSLLASREGLDTRDRILRVVYGQQLGLSSLAPLVLEGAESGDTVCRRILQEAANALADQVRAAVDSISSGETIGVVPLGGLVERGTPYSRVLEGAIQRHCPDVEIRKPLRTPVEGAVWMALGLAGDRHVS